MYSVSHPCPNSGWKNPVRFVWRKCHSHEKSTALGLKIQATARNVSGTIDRIASVVANTVPSRRPRTAGIASNTSPTTEIPSVHHAIGELIGVNPDVESFKRSTM